MRLILYFSNYTIIFIIVFVILYGIIEKKDVFQIFINGVKDGEKIFLDLIPTWIGLFVAVGMMKKSGLMNFFTNLLCNMLKFAKEYQEIIPLVLLRPISGSSSTAMGIEIMKKVGVDSKLGILTSCIMGSTETTIYVVALYTSKLKCKNIKPIVIIGIIGDLICILSSVLFIKYVLKY